MNERKTLILPSYTWPAGHLIAVKSEVIQIVSGWVGIK